MEPSMATMTYYVALAFTRSEDGGDIIACEPKEARSADQAIRMAGKMAAEEGHCGAIAFSRTGDPMLGDFEDAVILKTVGEVDSGALAG
jgi:Asp/Glu/hydantoin racemase